MASWLENPAAVTSWNSWIKWLKWWTAENYLMLCFWIPPKYSTKSRESGCLRNFEPWNKRMEAELDHAVTAENSPNRQKLKLGRSAVRSSAGKCPKANTLPDIYQPPGSGGTTDWDIEEIRGQHQDGTGSVECRICRETNCSRQEMGCWNGQRFGAWRFNIAKC